MLQKLSVYIHIPFCSSRCDYCNFFSSTLGEEVQRKYIESVKKELVYYSNYALDYEVQTIYIGGGTPSILFDGAIREIAKTIYDNFNVNLVEFTVEANPSSLTDSKIEEYKKSGVNRISLGVQSLNDKCIEAVSRKQNNQIIIPLIKKLTDVFDVVSADVMIGLPYSNKSIVLNDVDKLIGAGVKHISAYALSVEESTKLFDNVNSGNITLIDEDEQAEIYDAVYSLLKTKGFTRYEVSNFATLNNYSKHNYAYWIGTEYLGIGAGAHGYFENTRYSNVYDIKCYCMGVNGGLDYIRESEHVLSEKEIKNERIMLGLRLNAGIEFTQELFEKVNNSPYKDCFDVKNDRIKIKDNYFYVMNTLINELIEY